MSPSTEYPGGDMKKIDINELKAKCKGRWLPIFQKLGIDIGLYKKHSGCPICGPGNNAHRFRMDDRDGSGSWICNQCGAGDGISLVQKTIGLNFQQAVKHILASIGENTTMEHTPNEMSLEKKKSMLNELWLASVPLTGSDPVSLYLHSRRLVIQPDNVRFCAECYESDTKRNYQAMIAKFVNRDGVPIALHRTYLANGKKADIKSPKKNTPSIQPMPGGAVRLQPVKGNEIAITEGIETALACIHLFDRPVWAALNTSNLKGFLPPEGIRKVMIYGDCDANWAGHRAAYTLANKLYLMDYIVDVVIPTEGDFADVWLVEAIEDEQRLKHNKGV